MGFIILDEETMKWFSSNEQNVYYFISVIAFSAVAYLLIRAGEWETSICFFTVILILTVLLGRTRENESNTRFLQKIRKRF